MSTRVVVCAANLYGPVMFLGARHFDICMQKQMAYVNIYDLRKEFGEVQGFIDQYGVFMDRKEAMTVAIASGQLNRYREKVGPLDTLFSEDLY